MGTEIKIGTLDTLDDFPIEREIVRAYFDKVSSAWIGALTIHRANPEDELLSLNYYDTKLASVEAVDHALDVYIDSGLYDGAE